MRARQIRRPREQRRIAGVCAGVAHYLGVDPTVVRVALVILTVVSWGWMALLYPLLWFAIPAAPRPAGHPPPLPGYAPPPLPGYAPPTPVWRDGPTVTPLTVEPDPVVPGPPLTAAAREAMAAAEAELAARRRAREQGHQ